MTEPAPVTPAAASWRTELSGDEEPNVQGEEDAGVEDEDYGGEYEGYDIEDEGDGAEDEDDGVEDEEYCALVEDEVLDGCDEAEHGSMAETQQAGGSDDGDWDVIRYESDDAAADDNLEADGSDGGQSVGVMAAPVAAVDGVQLHLSARCTTGYKGVYAHKKGFNAMAYQ
eukprot:3040136-Prymnesium_polylepis.1